MRGPGVWCALLVLCVAGLCASAAADDHSFKKVATVPLPCESPYQFMAPSGDQVVVGCKDRTSHLLNIPSGAESRSFAGEPEVTSVAFSRDGKWFGMGRWDGSVDAVPTNGRSGAGPGYHINISARVAGLWFLPDDSGMLIAPIDGAGQIWDLRGGTPKQVASLPVDFSGINDIAFSPDGKLLVTVGADTIVRYYDAANWKLLHEYRKELLEAFTVAFSADGKHVLVGGADHGIIELDAEGNELRHLDQDTGVVGQISPFGDKGLALVNYFDGEGHAPPHRSIWDEATGKSSAMPEGPKFSGMQVVHGKAQFVRAEGKTLEVWEME